MPPVHLRRSSCYIALLVNRCTWWLVQQIGGTENFRLSALAGVGYDLQHFGAITIDLDRAKAG